MFEENLTLFFKVFYDFTSAPKVYRSRRPTFLPALDMVDPFQF